MNNKIVITSIFATFLALITFSVLFVVGKNKLKSSETNGRNVVETTNQSSNSNSSANNPNLPDENKINKFIGKRFIDFHGIDEEGKEVAISDMIQGKPAVIIFFAIGDKPGTFDFMPYMDELYQKYNSKVQFVAVLLSRSDSEEVKELKEMVPINMPVLRGYSDAIKNYEISKVDVPYMLFIDKNGVIKHIILRPESEMIREAPYVEHKNYKDKTQEERIKSSIKEIEIYINEIGD